MYTTRALRKTSGNQSRPLPVPKPWVPCPRDRLDSNIYVLTRPAILRFGQSVDRLINQALLTVRSADTPIVHRRCILAPGSSIKCCMHLPRSMVDDCQRTPANSPLHDRELLHRISLPRSMSFCMSFRICLIGLTMGLSDFNIGILPGINIYRPHHRSRQTSVLALVWILTDLYMTSNSKFTDYDNR